MKYIFCILSTVLILTCFNSGAQSIERFAVATGGDVQNNASGSLSFTVGEVSVSMLTGGSSILTQGFQQPDTSSITFVEENTSAFSIDIFPDPVSEFLTYRKNKINQELAFSFYDNAGRLIAVSESKNDLQVVFDVSKLAEGLYTLKVADAEKKTIAAKKFVKQ